MEGRGFATHWVTLGLWSFCNPEVEVPFSHPLVLIYSSSTCLGIRVLLLPPCSALQLRQLSPPACIKSYMKNWYISFNSLAPFWQYHSCKAACPLDICYLDTVHFYSPSRPQFLKTFSLGTQPISSCLANEGIPSPTFLTTVIGSRKGEWPNLSQSEPRIGHLGNDF